MHNSQCHQSAITLRFTTQLYIGCHLLLILSVWSVIYRSENWIEIAKMRSIWAFQFNLRTYKWPIIHEKWAKLGNQLHWNPSKRCLTHSPKAVRHFRKAQGVVCFDWLSFWFVILQEQNVQELWQYVTVFQSDVRLTKSRIFSRDKDVKFYSVMASSIFFSESMFQCPCIIGDWNGSNRPIKLLVTDTTQMKGFQWFLVVLYMNCFAANDFLFFFVWLQS